MHKFRLLFIIFLTLLTSCSVGTNDIQTSFLNYKYILSCAGDLNGVNPTSGEVLNRNKGFKDYTSRFNKNSCYINFQCLGTSYDDFRCETTFFVQDKKNTILIDRSENPFLTSFSGGQRGIILFNNEYDSESIGTIFVYTPYWCRWQCLYDLEGDGELILLTFEFWKKEYNPLPGFIKN